MHTTARLALLAAVAVAAMFTGPEWLYAINESGPAPCAQPGQPIAFLPVIPCTTDTDCMEKNPHIKF